MRCDNHPILQNTEFWLVLEYALSGWLQQHDDPDMRRLWCDGLVPEFVNRKKAHIEVEGDIWWMVGSVAKDWRFLAFIPNAIADASNPKFGFSEVEADPQRGFVRIRIVDPKSGT